MLKALALVGCLAVAACATQGPVVDGPLSPVPKSTLVSNRNLQFRLADKGTTRILVHQPSGAPAVPVASVSDAGVSIAEGLPRDVRLATIEQLYALVFRLDPLQVAKHGRSHTEMLRELATARAATGAAVPWYVVTMSPQATGSADTDDVAVRVMGEAGPLEGVDVFFNRAPHSGCVAKSREDGLATCRLVDQHGDDGEHDDHDVPVVVTYPGDVRADRVLAPTTLVIAGAP